MRSCGDDSSMANVAGWLLRSGTRNVASTPPTQNKHGGGGQQVAIVVAGFAAIRADRVVHVLSLRPLIGPWRAIGGPSLFGAAGSGSSWAARITPWSTRSWATSLNLVVGVQGRAHARRGAADWRSVAASDGSAGNRSLRRCSSGGAGRMAASPTGSRIRRDRRNREGESPEPWRMPRGNCGRRGNGADWRGGNRSGPATVAGAIRGRL